MDLRKWALGVTVAFCACASSGSQKSSQTASNAQTPDQGSQGIASDTSVNAGPSQSASGSEGAGNAATPSGNGDTSSDGSSTGASGMTPGPSNNREELSGTVAQVWNNAVKIETADGSSHVLRVVPETRIWIHGQAMSATDLKQGQEVRASYSNVNGHDTAIRIRSESSSSMGSGTGSSGSDSDSMSQPGTGGGADDQDSGDSQ